MMFNQALTYVVCLLGPLILLPLISRIMRGERDDAEGYRIQKISLLVLLVWFGIALVAGVQSGLSFPIFGIALAGPLLIFTALSFVDPLRSWLKTVPVHWLALLQVYRVAGALFLYLYYTGFDLSRGFALNAGWGDVLTGVIAIPAALLLMKKRYGIWPLVILCAVGIGDLILAPLSAYLYGAGQLSSFPLNMIPLFTGPPLGISLHILSLRAYVLQNGSGGGKSFSIWRAMLTAISGAKRLILFAGITLGLSACASARLPDTPTAISGLKESNISLEQAVSALTPNEGQTIRFSLCEANAQTGQCLEPVVGLAGYGLGGVFLPLLMRVSGFELSRDKAMSADTLQIEFATTVNEIAPFCAQTNADFEILQGDILRLGATPFYCNWIGIGNVVTQIEFGIDRVNIESQSFTGSYALQLNGTGNAIGEGSFRAEIVEEVS